LQPSFFECGSVRRSINGVFLQTFFKQIAAPGSIFVDYLSLIARVPDLCMGSVPLRWVASGACRERLFCSSKVVRLALSFFFGSKVAPVQVVFPTTLNPFS